MTILEKQFWKLRSVYTFKQENQIYEAPFKYVIILTSFTTAPLTTSTPNSSSNSNNNVLQKQILNELDDMHNENKILERKRKISIGDTSSLSSNQDETPKKRFKKLSISDLSPKEKVDILKGLHVASLSHSSQLPNRILIKRQIVQKMSVWQSIGYWWNVKGKMLLGL